MIKNPVKTFKENLKKIDSKDVRKVSNAKVKSNVALENQVKDFLLNFLDISNDVKLELFSHLTTTTSLSRKLADLEAWYFRQLADAFRDLFGKSVLKKTKTGGYVEKMEQYRLRPLEKKKIIERLLDIDKKDHKFVHRDVLPQLKRIMENDSQVIDHTEEIQETFQETTSSEKFEELKVLYWLYDKYVDYLRKTKSQQRLNHAQKSA